MLYVPSITVRLSDIQAVSRRLPTSAELEAVRDFQQGFWRQPHAATSELVLVIEAESRSYRFLLQTQQQVRPRDRVLTGTLHTSRKAIETIPFWS